MRRAPTHRWRGGRVAEGGGLLNRYTVNPVSWVRIPSPPPPSLSLPRVLRLGARNGGVPRCFLVKPHQRTRTTLRDAWRSARNSLSRVELVWLGQDGGARVRSYEKVVPGQPKGPHAARSSPAASGFG